MTLIRAMIKAGRAALINAVQSAGSTPCPGCGPSRPYHVTYICVSFVLFPPLRSITLLIIPRLATAQNSLTRIGRQGHRLGLSCPPQITRHSPGHFSRTPTLFRSGICRPQLTRRPPRPRPADRPELIVGAVKVRRVVVPVQQRVLRLHSSVLACIARCLVRLSSPRKASWPAHGTDLPRLPRGRTEQLLRGGLDLDGYPAAALQRGF